MKAVGYLLVLFSIYFMYANELLIGSIAFIIGGYFAKKVSISLRSLGVVIMLISIAYGYHHEYSLLIFFILLAGFVMSTFNSQRISDNRDWGIDIDWSSVGSDAGGDSGGGD